TAVEQGNYEGLLELLGTSQAQQRLDAEDATVSGYTSREATIVEAVLKVDPTGYLVKHPYINQQLNKLLARWTFKLCTGGGFRRADLPERHVDAPFENGRAEWRGFRLRHGLRRRRRQAAAFRRRPLFAAGTIADSEGEAQKREEPVVESRSSCQQGQRQRDRFDHGSSDLVHCGRSPRAGV